MSGGTDAYDVVIAGGGVIGSACAYFLAAEPTFDGTIAVIEPDPTYSTASTSFSVGGIRRQFSTEENILISAYSWAFFEKIDQHLSVDGEVPYIGLVKSAYLFLATEAGVEGVRANHETQRRLGADVAVLSPSDLTARFPWMAVDDLAAGSLGLSGEGWVDPYGLLQAFRRKARSLGVTYVKDRVVGVRCEDRRVNAVVLESGQEIASGWLVNAAGPRAAAVAAMAGIPLPVHPRKRMVFSFTCQDPPGPTPLVIDPTGMYFRPEGDGYITGISPPPEADPDCLDHEVDYTWFEDRLWPLLARRVPAFEAIRMTGAWAGHYAVNTLDGNAILGPHPEIENLLFANGFSGHGIQQSPAVGRATAEWIAFGVSRSLDLRRFGYDRIVSGSPVRERAIV